MAKVQLDFQWYNGKKFDRAAKSLAILQISIAAFLNIGLPKLGS